MKSKKISLSDVPVGKSARVVGLSNNGPNRRRFLDLGLVKGTVVDALYNSPAKNPVAYRIRGAVIALRNEDALDILVEYI